MESIRYRSRVLIIGSGLAGCTAALVLANQGHEVSLLTPADELDGGNSTMAQGGIVFVKDKEEARALESDMYVAVTTSARRCVFWPPRAGRPCSVSLWSSCACRSTIVRPTAATGI